MTRSKFGAVRTTVDGITFASKKEAKRYQELRLLERAKEITDLILQPRFPLQIHGKSLGSYVGDFQYTVDGVREVVEDVKGVRTPVYRLKKKIVEAIYGITIQEV